MESTNDFGFGFDSTSEGGSLGSCTGGDDLRKGQWTSEEDAKLVAYVRKYGERNWNSVQKISGLARCGKSCRLRWANHLRPDLKKCPLSPQEEQLIVELHATYGNKWSRIAAMLPGRTDNEIKNYWNTRVKKHNRQGLPLYPPEIESQQQPNPGDGEQRSGSCSMPTTPTSDFVFQTQLPSPTLTHTHTNPNPDTPTSPALTLVSPLTSPVSPITPISSSTTTSAAFPTPPLFGFAFPRPPPILQTPLCFKRSSSSSLVTSNTTATSIPTLTNIMNTLPSHINNPSTCCSLPVPPLSPISSPNISPHCQNIPCGVLTKSNSEFHLEIERENQKMRSLLASVTQLSELPSSQSPSIAISSNQNSAITSATYGRRMKRRKFGTTSYRMANNDLGAAESGNIRNRQCLFDDAKLNGMNINKQISHLNLLEQEPKELMLNSFGSEWNRCSSQTLSSGLKPTGEVAGQLNSMPEDLTNLLNVPSHSSVEAELYMERADISKGLSSFVNNDNIDFNMQQMTTLFPTTAADHSKAVGSCSWDKLPRIC